MMKSKYSSCQFNVTLYFQKIDDDDRRSAKPFFFSELLLVRTRCRQWTDVPPVDGTRDNCASADGRSHVSAPCVCRTDLQI